MSADRPASRAPRPSRALAIARAFALFVAAIAHAPRAHAAGLYFADRGVRPLGRGGAFVAGADDLGAIFYNPAGLVDAGSQVLLDASWVRSSTSFTRQVRVTPVDPNTGQPGRSSFVQTFDRVDSTSPLVPLPTLAGSYRVLDDLVVAAGVYAPYAALNDYPETLPDGRPAPQRYSVVSLDGSALAVAGVWAGWRPLRWLQIGAGPTALLGRLQSTVVFGACPSDRFLCAPEDPAFDARGRATGDPIVAPGAAFGAIAAPIDGVRIGASLQLPYRVDAPARVQAGLPSSALFDGASVAGERARMRFRLPTIARLGVEARPAPATRAEVAFVHEGWGAHDRIELEPEDLELRNVTLFPPVYRPAPVAIDRGFVNAWSLRAGAERRFALGWGDLDVRAGGLYEKSAVPAARVSVLSLDADKVTLAAGASAHLGGRWRVDGVLAVMLPVAVDVSPDEAALQKVTPVRANVSGREPPINGGRYEASAVVVGLGAVYRFGDVTGSSIEAR